MEPDEWHTHVQSPLNSPVHLESVHRTDGASGYRRILGIDTYRPAMYFAVPCNKAITRHSFFVTDDEIMFHKASFIKQIIDTLPGSKFSSLTYFVEFILTAA